MKRRMKKILCVLTACVLTSGTFLNLEQAATSAYASEVSEEQKNPVTQENFDKEAAECMESEKSDQNDSEAESAGKAAAKTESSEGEIAGKDVDAAGNSAKEILDLMGADEPLAVKLHIDDWGIARAAQRMLMTKSTEKLFAAYYPDDTFNCQESFLYLDKEWAWCMEPSEVVGNVGSGVYYAVAEKGDAAQWMKNKYGWSWAKINNLAKAIYLAKVQYKDDGMCAYVLVQNLIWAQITASESVADTGYYLLTNGAGNTTYVCEHLNTKDKVKSAIADVWKQVDTYHRMPSFDKQTIHVTTGQSYWIPDTNGVVNDVTFSSPSGLQISKGWDGSNVGIWIRADAAMEGRSVNAAFTKHTIPAGEEGVLIYDSTDIKRQTLGLWSGAITPDYGAFRVTVDSNDYLNAHYKAREAVSPSFDIHIEKTDADTGKYLSGAVFDIYMDGVKAASVTTDKDGKAAYHWRGDVLYTSYYEDTQPVKDYSEWENAYATARKNVKQKAADALADLKTQTTHTWKVVESRAPGGYEVNDTVWEQTFDLNTEAVEVDYSDGGTNGYLKVKKVSENPGITDGNENYSLEGAVYGIYKTADDAKKNLNCLGTLTTDAEGTSEETEVSAGTYYVKEVTAPDGYELCSEKENAQAEAGIHTVQVKSNETTTFTCKEKPGDNPLALVLQKLDQRTGLVSASGTASVRGAIFELSYYANTDGTVDSAIRKWYFKTDENGTFSCNENQQVVKKYQTNAGDVFQSDAFYKDTDGKTVYPIGTYQIREVSAPLYFQKAGYMHFVTNKTENADVAEGLTAVIRQETNGGKTQVYDGNRLTDGKIEAANLKVEAYDEPQYGSVTIYKEETDGSRKPLPGVTFKMVGQTDGTEYEAQTDADGKIVWEQLVSQKYVITEVQTADGKGLLKEPIEVSLPMEMTWEEIQKNGADPAQAVFDEVSEKYCFYNVSFTVGNGVTFDMPVTGGTSDGSYILLICGLAAAAAGGFILLKRSSRKYHKNEKIETIKK